MKFFIALLCLLPLISGMSVDTSSSKCYVDYLKNKGFLGGKKEAPRDVTAECLTSVEEAESSFVERLRKKFLADEDTSSQTECILTKLKKTDFFDRELIEHLDVSAASADAETVEQSEALGLLSNVINIVKALMSCEVEKIFDDEFTGHVKFYFDALFEGEPEEKEDNVDYCVRKHLVDNHLISFNADKFNVNPKNLDTSSFDCNAIYQAYSKGFEETLFEAFDETFSSEDDPEDDKKWGGCFLRIVRKNNYVEKLMQFDYVKEYNLTAEQKEELRSIFAEAFTNVATTAAKCTVPEGMAGL